MQITKGTKKNIDFSPMLIDPKQSLLQKAKSQLYLQQIEKAYEKALTQATKLQLQLDNVEEKIFTLSDSITQLKQFLAIELTVGE